MKENSQLSSSFTYIFHKIPIKDIIIGEPLSVEQVPEMKIYLKIITIVYTYDTNLIDCLR